MSGRFRRVWNVEDEYLFCACVEDEDRALRCPCEYVAACGVEAATCEGTLDAVSFKNYYAMK